MQALTIIKQKKYSKADMLVISDFIMTELSETLLNEITQQREFGNKFNSFLV